MSGPSTTWSGSRTARAGDESIDANLLLYCYSEASPYHREAKAFIERLASADDVALSELVLVEFYTLLRNPAVVEHPLDPGQAVGVRFRATVITHVG